MSDKDHTWRALAARFDWPDEAIPSLLEALTVPECAEDALETIEWSEFHQGMPSSDLAPVLRVLGRQLAEGAMAAPEAGFELLAEILDSCLLLDDDPDFAPAIRSCRAAMRDVVDDLTKLLDDDRDAWRWAWLARLSPEVSPACLAELRRVAATRSAEQLVLCAVAALAAHTSDVDAGVANAEEPRLRIASALGRVWRGGADPADLAVLSNNRDEAQAVLQLIDGEDLVSWLAEYNRAAAITVLSATPLKPADLAALVDIMQCTRVGRDQAVTWVLDNLHLVPPGEAVALLSQMPLTPRVLDEVDRLGRLLLQNDPTANPQASVSATTLAFARDPRWEEHFALFVDQTGELPALQNAGPVQTWEQLAAVPSGPALASVGRLIDYPGMLGWVARWPAEVSWRLRDDLLTALPNHPAAVARVMVAWGNASDAELLRPYTAQDPELWFHIARLSGDLADWRRAVAAPDHTWEGRLDKEELQLLFPDDQNPQFLQWCRDVVALSGKDRPAGSVTRALRRLVRAGAISVDEAWGWWLEEVAATSGNEPIELGLEWLRAGLLGPARLAQLRALLAEIAAEPVGRSTVSPKRMSAIRGLVELTGRWEVTPTQASEVLERGLVWDHTRAATLELVPLLTSNTPSLIPLIRDTLTALVTRDAPLYATDFQCARDVLGLAALKSALTKLPTEPDEHVDPPRNRAEPSI